MYTSRFLSAAIVIGVAVGTTIIACSNSSPGRSPDAKVFKDSSTKMDGNGGSSSNALGQLCPFNGSGTGNACPSGNSCVQVSGNNGSAVGSNKNEGYCTPDCMGMNSGCTTGYTGPSTGMPMCVLNSGSGSAADGCAIICTQMIDCPTGTSCAAVPGTTAKICAPT